LTTLAGRSITSPAAILFTTLGGSWRIAGMEPSLAVACHSSFVIFKDWPSQ